MIVQALFDYALAEATGGPETNLAESVSFIRKVRMMKCRIDALVGELDEALEVDEAHQSSSA